MPNNFILTQTGLTLRDIEKIGLSPKNFITLLALAFLALIPTLFKKKYEEVPQNDPLSEEAPKVLWLCQIIYNGFSIDFL